MVLMAGMLPGVECARRRRVRQQSAAEAPPACGTRRPSLLSLYTGGHSSGLSKQEMRVSSACKEKETAHAWTLDSAAREAKERLDQKLRSQRESVVKRGQSTGAMRISTTTRGSGSNGVHDHSATTAAEEAGVMCALQREVLTNKTKNGGGAAGRRFIWNRLGRKPGLAAPAPAPAEEECVVCLEELRAGDVLVHLPCAHRFHWSCAVPWVQAASRCPVCRAPVHLIADQQPAAAGAQVLIRLSC